MRLSVPKKKQSLENTIPLINIVFLMLIFFIFAGTIDRDDAKSVRVPEKSEKTEQISASGALVVAQDGSLQMNETAIELEQINKELYSKEEPLVVVASKDMQAINLLKIINELKKSGITEILLLTKMAVG
ncbi:ExbD/TolR family protein [Polycladidibacter stylochi]|uniref:ExbD/TolR family protein n=1 Tax=Polycladidibacter stylochi TaxID=1807766 RepID=UPI00082DD2B6|nr:biopolymer transporter ExbD [Pseudovibrio stylochi]